MSEVFETYLRETARHLPYPATPRLQAAQPPRRNPILVPQRAALVLLLVVLSGLAIPDLRAALLEFLQIGAVTITLDGTGTSGETLNLEAVAGETDLESVQAEIAFPLLVPPNNLPDRVFVQDAEMVILVWLAEDRIEHALYQIANYDWAVLKEGGPITSTEVGTAPAYWVDLQHPVVFLLDGVLQSELTHFVDGNVLIWTQDDRTYRLETRVSMDAARRFAESLVIIP